MGTPIRARLTFVHDGKAYVSEVEVLVRPRSESEDTFDVHPVTGRYLSACEVGAADGPRADLTWVTIEQMRDELMSRADHGIVSLLHINEVDRHSHSYRTAWKGNRLTCMGLAERMVHKLNQSLDESDLVDGERGLDPPPRDETS